MLAILILLEVGDQDFSNNDTPQLFAPPTGRRCVCSRTHLSCRCWCYMQNYTLYRGDYVLLRIAKQSKAEADQPCSLHWNLRWIHRRLTVLSLQLLMSISGHVYVAGRALIYCILSAVLGWLLLCYAYSSCPPMQTDLTIATSVYLTRLLASSLVLATGLGLGRWRNNPVRWTESGWISHPPFEIKSQFIP